MNKKRRDKGTRESIQPLIKRMKRIKKKLFGSILVVVVFTNLYSVNLAADASKYAYTYGFKYADGKVDTTEIAKQEQMYLNNMKYKTYCNTTVSASFAVANSPNTNLSRMNSGVFVFNGHAGPGSCQFYDSNGKNTYLTAKKSGNSYKKFDGISLDQCKAAFFMGCKTASTSRKKEYGVLTQQAVDNGAKCSFGWKKSVLTKSATTFRERFFYFLNKGYSVSDSAKNAASEMPRNDTTRKYKICGKGSTKLSTGAKQSVMEHTTNIVKSKAVEIIKSQNYVEQEGNEGSKLYVRYIWGIPTMQTIEIFSDGTAKINNLKYDTEVAKTLKDLSQKKTNNVNVANVIYSGGTVFRKYGATEQEKTFCIIDGKTKLIQMYTTEYISSNGETYYLDIVCVDVKTGREIDYTKVIEGCYE